MKDELELRILDVDKDKVIQKLESLGAKKEGDWYYKRYVYDTKPYDEDKWIRLRTNGIETTLTYKEYLNDTIDGVKELEIIVSSFDNTIKMLEILGYIPRSIQENKRIRYMLDDVEIDIDTWPHLNPYVEFEGNSEEQIKEVVEMLGLDYSKCITENAQDIYKRHPLQSISPGFSFPQHFQNILYLNNLLLSPALYRNKMNHHTHQKCLFCF